MSSLAQLARGGTSLAAIVRHQMPASSQIPKWKPVSTEAEWERVREAFAGLKSWRFDIAPLPEIETIVDTGHDSDVVIERAKLLERFETEPVRLRAEIGKVFNLFLDGVDYPGTVTNVQLPTCSDAEWKR